MSLTKRTQLNLESLDQRIVPTVMDLTTAGASFNVNGTIIHHMDATWNQANGGAQAHGSSSLNTYLAVNHTGTETGVNTTGPLQAGMDTTVAVALTLDKVPVVTVGGNQYYEFVLNVNEPAGSRKLSVDELQLFVSGRSDLTTYNAANNTLSVGTGKNKVTVNPAFDLTAGDATNSLQVKAKANVSATGEVAVLVPVGTLGTASSGTYVYIYTKITGAGGGDEQWGVRQPPVTGGGGGGGTGSLAGFVFVDADRDGMLDNGESGEGGVTVTLSGTDSHGNSVSLQTMTLADGSFLFSGVPVGSNYTITEQSHNGFLSEFSSAGTEGGDDSVPGLISGINLLANHNGSGYIFGDVFFEG